MNDLPYFWSKLSLGQIGVFFDYARFAVQGGLDKMHLLFGDGMDCIIDELNRKKVA